MINPSIPCSGKTKPNPSPSLLFRADSGDPDRLYVIAGDVQKAVETLFGKEGYQTTKNSRLPQGFFHALGHGVGLEIHKEPIIRSGSPVKLKAGMVVTVEPGLCYRRLGGVRIEDVVHITKYGNEKISSAPYKWEIP